MNMQSPFSHTIPYLHNRQEDTDDEHGNSQSALVCADYRKHFQKRKLRIRFSVVKFYFSVHGIHRITTQVS